VEQRVRAVGGLQIYLPILTGILATLFGVIGILVWMSDPSSVGNQAASGDRDD
jgi:flagellar motor component MotA